MERSKTGKVAVDAFLKNKFIILVEKGSFVFVFYFFTTLVSISGAAGVKF